MNSGAVSTITRAGWMRLRRLASAAPLGMVCTAPATAATVVAESWMAA